MDTLVRLLALQYSYTGCDGGDAAVWRNLADPFHKRQVDSRYLERAIEYSAVHSSEMVSKG